MKKNTEQDYTRKQYQDAEKESIATVCTNLMTTSDGLSAEEVAKRHREYGKNELPKQKGTTLLKSLWAQMNNAMIYVLLIAALISFILALIERTNQYFEPILILAIVVLNALIGTIQELRADKALSALEKLSAPTTVVRRAGVLLEIPARELVPGDIVLLEDGRKAPADLRVLKSYNLKLSEASLTGESVPVSKEADVTFPNDVPLGDRSNIVYMTTPVVYGRGEGIVINTGLNTEVGKIAQSLANAKAEVTPLQKRLEDLSVLLGYITLGLVGLLFLIGLIKSIGSPNVWHNIKDMFLLAISLAVAAVPEGLAAVVTITLALGVQKMVKVNTIVRRLPSVETLGAVSVICSDKTGTLTKNEMHVTRAYVLGNFTSDVTSSSEESIITLARGLALASDATVEHGVYGDPTEIALVRFARNLNMSKVELENSYPRINELPFDSTRKMMSTLHETKSGNVQYTKGALDALLKLVTKINDNGKVRPISESDKHLLNKHAQMMTSDALRIIALATRTTSTNYAQESALTFIGFVGLFDPPRPEAGPAVTRLRQAGITTMMITGDHQDTAFVVARELGITNDEAAVISGAELDLLNEDALSDALSTKRVFARVSPQNKVQIVDGLKRNGHIVAMTGDGVNDAPSLQSANIGIAMGITGTDVAKGAADMVLSDDNFASIEKAVSEGRGIYKNVQKTVWFLLSSNIGEVLTMLVAALVGFPFPLRPLHILWVNLITDSLPALALGSDTKSSDVMLEAPRPRDESLFAGGGYRLLSFYGILISLITLGAFLYVPLSSGARGVAGINAFFSANPAQLIKAQTYAFTTLGVSQLFHMFGMSNIKQSALHTFNKRKWFLWVAFFFGFVFQVLVTEITFLTVAFGTSELTLVEWLFLALLSATPLFVHELKVLLLRLLKHLKK